MATVSKRRNRYVLDFYDHEGKRIRETMPKGTTKRAAQDELNAILEKIKARKYTPEARMPTFKTAADEWLKKKKQKIRSSTWSVYEGHVRNHFAEFHHIKVDRITTEMIEAYIEDQETAGMPMGTLKKILVSLGQIFKFCVKRGYCMLNPVSEADRPRGQGTDLDEQLDNKKQIRVMTVEQIREFLELVHIQKYHALFTLAIFSGARQGELLGLKWSDINWQDKQIHIQRTFNNGSFFETKTKGSNRWVDIGPTTMKVLKEWKLACPPGKLDLVFPTNTGGPMNHNNMVNRYFKPTITAMGLNLRFHDLRHTYASLLIEQGENVKYIQDQLGHSTPIVTLDVYAHLMRPSNPAAANKLETAVLTKKNEPVTEWSQK